MSRVYQASGTRSGIDASIVAVVMKGGVVASLSGGDLPHVGAVALAEPRPSRKDSSKTSSSVSVLVRLGHKEDELARRLSGEMAASLDLPVVLSVGIHVDGATEAQIREAELLAVSLVSEAVPGMRRLLEGMPSTENRSL